MTVTDTAATATKHRLMVEKHDVETGETHGTKE